MDFINIIGTIFDNSVEHIAALANQIKDLRLGKNQQDINEDIYNKIQELSEGGTASEKIKHVFITQEEYDALESYERDTLYLIIEYHNTGSGSQFGDAFPLIFA